MRPEVLAEELSFASPLLATAWLWLIRVVAPVAILGIMYNSLLGS